MSSLAKKDGHLLLKSSHLAKGCGCCCPYLDCPSSSCKLPKHMRLTWTAGTIPTSTDPSCWNAFNASCRATPECSGCSGSGSGGGSCSIGFILYQNTKPVSGTWDVEPLSGCAWQANIDGTFCITDVCINDTTHTQTGIQINVHTFGLHMIVSVSAIVDDGSDSNDKICYFYAVLSCPDDWETLPWTIDNQKSAGDCFVGWDYDLGVSSCTFDPCWFQVATGGTVTISSQC